MPMPMRRPVERFGPEVCMASVWWKETSPGSNSRSDGAGLVHLALDGLAARQHERLVVPVAVLHLALAVRARQEAQAPPSPWSKG